MNKQTNKNSEKREYKTSSQIAWTFKKQLEQFGKLQHSPDRGQYNGFITKPQCNWLVNTFLHEEAKANSGFRTSRTYPEYGGVVEDDEGKAWGTWHCHPLNGGSGALTFHSYAEVHEISKAKEEQEAKSRKALEVAKKLMAHAKMPEIRDEYYTLPEPRPDFYDWVEQHPLFLESIQEEK